MYLFSVRACGLNRSFSALHAPPKSPVRSVLMPREMPPFFPPDAEGLFQVVEIRDGKIVAIRDFIHRDDAMAAAGL